MPCVVRAARMAPLDMAMDDSPAPFAWNYCPICGHILEIADDGQSDRPHCSRCSRFYYSNPAPAACCFVAWDDKLLFVQRSVEPRLGYWTMPGGFVEVGESPEEAALRELHEETGLVGVRPHLLGVSAKAHKFAGGVIVMGFVIPEWTGTLSAATDAMDAGFFNRHERPPLAFEAHAELIALYDAANHAGP